MDKNKEKITLKEFFKENDTVLAALGLFLIFTFEGVNFIKDSTPQVPLLSSLIWLCSLVIVLIILFYLSKQILFSDRKSILVIWIIRLSMFILLIVLFTILITGVISDKSLLNFVVGIPYAAKISAFMILALSIPVLDYHFFKEGAKIPGWIFFGLIILFLIIFPITGRAIFKIEDVIKIWSPDGTTGLIYYSLLISFVFETVSLIRDKIKDKNA